MDEAEIFNRLDRLESQINVISMQIVSLQVSKLSAATSFLQKALVYLKVCFKQDEGKLDKHAFDSAMNWLREANKNATEAFHDKINVSMKLREEAMQIMLFCSALEHYNNPRLVISNWEINVRDYMKDQEICSFYKVLTFIQQ